MPTEASLATQRRIHTNHDPGTKNKNPPYAEGRIEIKSMKSSNPPEAVVLLSSSRFRRWCWRRFLFYFDNCVSLAQRSFPCKVNQDRRGNEDRRIRTGDNSHKHRECKSSCHFPSYEE